MVVGGVGRGKTTWLTALLLDTLRKDPTVKAMWTTEQRLYRKAQLKAERSHGGRERIIQQAIDADLLLVDDLGAGRRDLTEWQGGAIRELIMERHLEGRATLISTNLQMPALEKQYGDHVASRLVEACGDVYDLGGADRRRSGMRTFLQWWGRE